MPSNALLLVRAQTPLHPGAGTSVGAIDLPVQREAATGWPTLEGTGVKGVLRDALRTHIMDNKSTELQGLEGETERDKADRHQDVRALFGTASDSRDETSGGYAGALCVTDLRLLAFPLRSARGLFAWVTCPTALDRLRRDCKLAQVASPVTDNSYPGEEEAHLTQEALDHLRVGANNQIVLENLIFQGVPQGENTAPAKLGAFLQENWVDAGLRPEQRVVVLSDTAFTFVVRHCTEIVSRVALEPTSKRVRTGALFSQEQLPPETLLYSVLLLSDARGGQENLTACKLLDWVKAIVGGRLLQLGGDETTGKGWCETRLYMKEEMKAEGQP